MSPRCVSLQTAIITLSLILWFLPVQGQEDKRSNVWLFGYNFSEDTTQTDYGGTVMDFSNGPPMISFEHREPNFNFTNASICDVNGNLLFYTNGLGIYDAANNLVIGGDSLNPGQYASNWSDVGYPLVQGALFIPAPGIPNRYYLLHKSLEYPIGDLFVHCPNLLYSVLEVDADIGATILEKNEILITDTLSIGKITAVKHSNGIDWWILSREYNANVFHRHLLTEAGFLEYPKIEIGTPLSIAAIGQAIFSPDGKFYAEMNLTSGENGVHCQLYDFDRCTGTLSNFRSVIKLDENNGAGGVVFSSNSKLLYLITSNEIYQYSLEADSIFASEKTVAVYDGFLDPFPTRFSVGALGPDGKIYLSSSNGTSYLHVIENPNLIGQFCNVQQHALELAAPNAFSMPNFVNYSLGPTDCDTLSSIDLGPEGIRPEILIYPNPTPGLIHIKSSTLQRDCSLHLYDALGRQQLRLDQPGSSEECTLDAQHLPAGLYYLVVQQAGKVVHRERVILVE